MKPFEILKLAVQHSNTWTQPAYPCYTYWLALSSKNAIPLSFRLFTGEVQVS